jgi:outer membrane protein OmpA-like peptidoglycan-associated protein
VPGEFLFAMDSDEVQAGAYDTLAKVAELIGTYDDHKVLIIGHSDAVGHAAYNRQLSERRAELVKQFFIDNFQLPPDRLAAEGVGEARPIASNATPQGRRANRRVEILILNWAGPLHRAWAVFLRIANVKQCSGERAISGGAVPPGREADLRLRSGR